MRLFARLRVPEVLDHEIQRDVASAVHLQDAIGEKS